MNDFVIDISRILLPPILAAALGGYAVNRLRAREESLDKRIDELCAEIKAASDEASNYWQLEPDDKLCKLSAAKMMAALSRIDGLRAIVSKNMSASSGRELAKAGSEFMRESTGGDFGVHNRPSDVLRAATVVREAAAYAVTIRSARMADLTGWRRRN